MDGFLKYWYHRYQESTGPDTALRLEEVGWKTLLSYSCVNCTVLVGGLSGD